MKKKYADVNFSKTISVKSEFYFIEKGTNFTNRYYFDIRSYIICVFLIVGIQPLAEAIILLFKSFKTQHIFINLKSVCKLSKSSVTKGKYRKTILNWHTLTKNRNSATYKLKCKPFYFLANILLKIFTFLDELFDTV